MIISVTTLGFIFSRRVLMYSKFSMTLSCLLKINYLWRLNFCSQIQRENTCQTKFIFFNSMSNQFQSFVKSKGTESQRSCLHAPGTKLHWRKERTSHILATIRAFPDSFVPSQYWTESLSILQSTVYLINRQFTSVSNGCSLILSFQLSP